MGASLMRSQVLAEGVEAVHLLEVLLPQLGRDVLQLLVGIGGVPRHVECILVHVGAVDFHPLPKLFDPHLLGEHHGYGIGLFAAGASGAPGPDRLGVGLRRQQRGDRHGPQRLPRLRVAEEVGDVDQDGVEQLTELVLVELDVLLVGIVRFDALHAHTLADPAGQRGGLVTLEIEAARDVQVLQQLDPPGVRREGCERLRGLGRLVARGFRGAVVGGDHPWSPCSSTLAAVALSRTPVLSTDRMVEA
jgi:hypothetical protein